MYIYKIINKINNKWYIGKHNGKNPLYMGSGKLISQAIDKYGKENFEKIILEQCCSEEQLNQKEKYWISQTNAVNDPLSYNLAEGGQGGDRSKFIDYTKIDYSNHNMNATSEWYNNLTLQEKKELHSRQAAKRTKGWYVSKVDDPTEVFVDNIAKWCRENNVDTSMPTVLNSPISPLFQKQTKGWRIRRSDMPPLPPYENRRGKVISRSCAGKTWKLIDGKRVWLDKYID